MIEDIVEVQALNSLRQFYTEDAGYRLWLYRLTMIFMRLVLVLVMVALLYLALPPLTASTLVVFFNDNGTTTQYTDDTLVAGDEFTDAFFRDMIQKMDDNNVPMEGRNLIVPPATRKAIMGIDRYVSSDFVSGGTVNNGLIGNLYGVDVYVSANCRTIEAALITLHLVMTSCGFIFPQ